MTSLMSSTGAKYSRSSLKHYESTILSEGEVFTTALMAAAGKFADMTNFEQLIQLSSGWSSMSKTARIP